jgi:putative phage-type endonuclease
MLTAEQKQQRTQGIGGSDAAVVVGLSPFKTPYQLYLEKRGAVPASEEETLAMKFGTLLEEPIAQHYCDVTGRQVRKQPTVFHDQYPFMLANIDRQILKDPRGPGVLEVKTTNEWSGRSIQGVEDIPDHYYCQAQHYMAVYDYAWASFAVLIGGQRFIWFDIERHDGVIAELIRQEAEFWERVQTGNPPPIDGAPRTGDLLKKLYPRDTGKVLTIQAPELIEAARQLVSAKALVKKVEADVTLYENQLKSAIGEASEAVLPGFGAITWKSAKDSVKESIDLDKLKAAYPEVYAACLTQELRHGGRRFLLKPTKECA